MGRKRDHLIQTGLSPISGLTEYSVEKDRAFCFPCQHFTTGTGKSDQAFTKDGFGDWKHALGKDGILQGHSKCHGLTHIQAMSSWNQFKLNQERGTSIENCLSSERSEQIRRNRYYIASVAKVILLCARLEIALRGHDESSDLINKGNFRRPGKL